MKKVFALLVVVFTFSLSVQAQDHSMKKEVKHIELEQTKGEFTQKTVTVDEGTYIFEVTNNYAGTDVGIVLVKKGEDISKPENHIKTAYVTEIVKEGQTQKSNPTVLTKGEYVYFCPYNNTATDNTLIVQ